MGQSTSCKPCCDSNDHAGEDPARREFGDDIIHQRNAFEDEGREVDTEKEKQEAERKRQLKKKKAAEKEAKEKAMREEAKRQAEEVERRKAEEEEKENILRQQRLGPLGNPGAKLQVQLDSGWSDLTPDEFKQVCDHVAGGGNKFPIQARGAMYFIDYSDPENITQKNVRTNKTRNMRIVS